MNDQEKLQAVNDTHENTEERRSALIEVVQGL